MENYLSNEMLHKRAVPRQADIRGDYFRDTTAILHSYPFRRLKNKTQVFYAPQNDHICTRIEHAFHVSTIAAAVCKGLGLDDELAWAAGLGHDLGHAPFGHTGERVLGELTGEFIHELFSLRVVDMLAGYGEGLNLTYAVRDAIVCHCGEQFEQRLTPRNTLLSLETLEDRTAIPATWEGVAVRFADKIAYVGRDIEDALQLKLIKQDDLPKAAAGLLGRSNRDIINTLVQDLIASSRDGEYIGMSSDVYEAMIELKDFNYRRIYRSPMLTGYYDYFYRMISLLDEYLMELFDRWGFESDEYKQEKNLLSARFGDYVNKMKKAYTSSGEPSTQIVLDYVAGMTDTYALACIQEILTPRHMHDKFNQFILEHD